MKTFVRKVMTIELLLLFTLWNHNNARALGLKSRKFALKWVSSWSKGKKFLERNTFLVWYLPMEASQPIQTRLVDHFFLERSHCCNAHGLKKLFGCICRFIQEKENKRTGKRKKDGLLNEGTWMHVWNYGVHVWKEEMNERRTHHK